MGCSIREDLSVLRYRDFRILLADRFKPQSVILSGNVLMTIGEGTFGVLTLTHSINVPTMIGLELITGTGMAVFWPASTALLPKIVPSEELQAARAVPAGDERLDDGRHGPRGHHGRGWRAGLGTDDLRHRDARHRAAARVAQGPGERASRARAERPARAQGGLAGVHQARVGVGHGHRVPARERVLVRRPAGRSARSGRSG